MYRDVAEDLRRRITSGEFRPGDPLPSDQELCDQWGVSRNTIRNAFALLVNEGLITPGRGRSGRRVRHRKLLRVYASRSEEMNRRAAAGVDAWVKDATDQDRRATQVIRAGVEHAPADVARWLEIDEGAHAAVRRRIRSLDGAPDNINDTWYPMDITKDVPEILSPDDVVQGLIALLRERGYEQVRYVDELSWRPPTPTEAEALRLRPGVAVLIQTRVGYTETRPVKMTQTIWPGDSHVMVYELPA